MRLLDHVQLSGVWMACKSPPPVIIIESGNRPRRLNQSPFHCSQGTQGEGGEGEYHRVQLPRAPHRHIRTPFFHELSLGWVGSLVFSFSCRPPFASPCSVQFSSVFPICPISKTAVRSRRQFMGPKPRVHRGTTVAGAAQARLHSMLPGRRQPLRPNRG